MIDQAKNELSISQKITDDYQLNLKDFTPDKSKQPIDGGFSKVSFVTQNSTGKKCVLKQTKPPWITKQKSFVQEVTFLATYHHPTIVPFIGFAIKTKKQKCGNIFLLEMPKGSLESFIRNTDSTTLKKVLDNTKKLIIAYGIACGMEYLHSQEVVHRDLKPENILLNDDLQPYITDFGTSRSQGAYLSINSTIRETTPTIMAPEFIENWIEYNRSPPIDVFSYSMILYHLIIERPPYDMKKTNIVKITNETSEGNRPEIPPGTDQKWTDLIQQCWSQNPSKRPTFTEICDKLESSEFLTPDINLKLFKSYKKKVRPSTIPTPKPIDELKEAADKGDAESQNLYALHLYNGINIEKNEEEARRYFELAAQNGSPDGCLFYSLLLLREGKIELSSQFYQQSLSKMSGEAYSQCAQQLIAQGDINNGFQYLLPAIQRSSNSAAVLYGNLCESYPQFGSKELFYEIASNGCHCLDRLGSCLPVDCKIFRCDTCGINEMCEGCARHCHKGHQIAEVRIGHSFVCGCGAKGFPDNSCSAKFVGESKCEGEPSRYQHLYRCFDCCPEDKFICYNCAKKCHEGHDVVDCGIRKGFCSCGLSKLDDYTKCKLAYISSSTPEKCSNTNNKPSLQRWFQCIDCGIYGKPNVGICQSCSENCHAGHKIIDLGIQSQTCQCKTYQKCELKK